VAAAPLLSKEEITALPGAYVVLSDAFVAPSNARVCQAPLIVLALERTMQKQRGTDHLFVCVFGMRMVV
jgi:hypothetical protein